MESHPVEEVHLTCSGSGCHEVSSLDDIPQEREFCLACHQDLVEHKIAPFWTMATLSDVKRRLAVISDVSCDPGENNPIPVYTTPTTFTDPTLRVIASPPLDLTAIDHLPSMLPVEASTDFGEQLLPYLLELGPEPKGVWRCALDVFEHKTRNL